MDELTSLYHLGNSGVPDRLVILPGAKIGFAEMKRPRRKNKCIARRADSNFTKIRIFCTSARQ